MISAGNPFSDENPFSDPSIENALSSTSYTALDIIPEDQMSQHTFVERNLSSSSIPQDTITAEKLKVKEEELRRKEEELRKREQNLQQQQDTMRRTGFKPHNWPKFYPFMYHDIQDEIPNEHRPIVTKLYKFWISTVGLLAFNMIATISLFASRPSQLNNTIGDFSGGIVYVVFITPASFFLWYRPVYNAYMKNNSFYFLLYLLFGGFHLLFSVYMAIGIPGSGGAGFINMLGAFSSGTIFAAVFCLLGSVAWSLESVAALYLWRTVHSQYRAAGHTLASAKNEAVGFGLQAGLQGNTINPSNGYVRSDTGVFQQP